MFNCLESNFIAFTKEIVKNVYNKYRLRCLPSRQLVLIWDWRCTYELSTVFLGLNRFTSNLATAQEKYTVKIGFLLMARSIRSPFPISCWHCSQYLYHSTCVYMKALMILNNGTTAWKVGQLHTEFLLWAQFSNEAHNTEKGLDNYIQHC